MFQGFKKRLNDNLLFSKHGNGTIAVLAAVLGVAFGFALGLAIFSESVWDFGLFLMFIAFFHFSEFLCVALFNPQQLSSDSFLINHSKEYTMAITASFIEYFIELWLFPNMKGIWFITLLGFLVTFVGQTIRLVALINAGHNFTHEIAETKKEKHVLVTDGIYSYIRHPGYLGWFWWSVGSQIILFNPICIAGFAYAAFTFFRDRIEYEEELLIDFFGDQYKEYRKRTPTYIPMIQ